MDETQQKQRALQRRAMVGTVLCLTAIVSVAGIVWWQSTTNDGPPTVVDRDSPAAARRPRPDDAGDYVGMQRCVECHEDIADRYLATHSMARATSIVGQEQLIESYDQELITPPGARVYQVERTADGIKHHELMLDRRGNPIYDHTEKISLIIGSGRRGRTYAIQRDGLLFQSPVSWYTQKQEFTLAPGYRPDDHQRFDRKIRPECMYCHAGRMAVSEQSADRFVEPVVLEGAIGCERCHGPGRRHVERQAGGTWQGPDDSIVNPGKLDPFRRDSVCYQCHLRADVVYARSDCQFHDFRPGQRFDDVWVAFVKGGSDLQNKLSVVEQFRASQCFVKSAGRLGCISCHDPHFRPPAAEMPQYYRQRCVACHNQDPACSLPVAEQQAPPAEGSCIHCHMPRIPTHDIPHTALTDHRIMRRPVPTPLDAELSTTDLSNLVIFADDESQLPETERRRATALVLATRAATSSDHQLAREAQQQMGLTTVKSEDQLLRILGNDPLALEKFGIVYAINQRDALAQACWQRALELSPNNETVLHSMTVYAISNHNHAQGREYAEQLIEANPHLAQYHWIYCGILEAQGKMDEAIRAAETAIELDPTAVPIHSWLAEAYRRQDAPDKALRHELMVQRMLGR